MLTFLGSIVLLLIIVVLLRIVRSAENGGFTSKLGDKNGILEFPRRARVLKASNGGAAASDPASRLKQLQEMKDSALITDEEYEAKRTQILDAL